MKRVGASALMLGIIGSLAIGRTAMAAFQIVEMSATSGDAGELVTITVDASHLIGGSDASQLFLIPRDAYDASPEPMRCDGIPGANVVGMLEWHAETVEFQGNTYPGYVGMGSFTVPGVETGIYIVAGILDDPYTGCHAFAAFGVGMELPDSAMADSGPAGRVLSVVGLGALFAATLLAGRRRRGITSVR